MKYLTLNLNHKSLFDSKREVEISGIKYVTYLPNGIRRIYKNEESKHT